MNDQTYGGEVVTVPLVRHGVEVKRKVRECLQCKKLNTLHSRDCRECGALLKQRDLSEYIPSPEDIARETESMRFERMAGMLDQEFSEDPLEDFYDIDDMEHDIYD